MLVLTQLVCGRPKSGLSGTAYNYIEGGFLFSFLPNGLQSKETGACNWLVTCVEFCFPLHDTVLKKGTVQVENVLRLTVPNYVKPLFGPVNTSIIISRHCIPSIREDGIEITS
jgi:hypothetical protein